MINLYQKIHHYQPSPMEIDYVEEPFNEFRQIFKAPKHERLFLREHILPILRFHLAPYVSPYSFGGVKDRSAQQAIEYIHYYVQQGYRFIVKIDIQKCFDNVNQDILLWQLKQIPRLDDWLLELVRKNIKAPIRNEHLELIPHELGIHPGGVLSTDLLNFHLSFIDYYLTYKNIPFCRHVDDIIILCCNSHTANLFYSEVANMLTQRLNLQINNKKSGVFMPWETGFLGYTYSKTNPMYLRPTELNIDRLISNMREVLSHWQADTITVSTCVDRLKKILKGWSAYFKYVEYTPIFEELQLRIATLIASFCVFVPTTFHGRAQAMYKFIGDRGIAYKLAGKYKNLSSDYNLIDDKYKQPAPPEVLEYIKNSPVLNVFDLIQASRSKPKTTTAA